MTWGAVCPKCGQIRAKCSCNQKLTRPLYLNRDELDKESLGYIPTTLHVDNKRIFDTGAHRDSNEDKPFVHNLQGYTRLRFGYLTNMGAKKYEDGNFLKGIPSSVALESLDRHLAKYIDGDRSEDHLAAIIFNVQLVMLNEQKEGIKADNYFK